jgi:hypothetical protein
MILKLGSVLDVPKNFHVLADMSIWQPSDYIQTAQGWTPKRDRAGFTSWQKSLLPTTQDANKLKDDYGIYIVAFEIPEPSLYIGIASNDTKSSEGVLNRFKKHRVKTSGSHVGTTTTSIGGVHHPVKWRHFAQQRFTALEGQPDFLTDVRIVVSSFVNTTKQPKKDLERFESSIICNQNNALDQIVDMLWPGKIAKNVRLLNGTRGRPKLTTEDQIIF